MSLLDLPAGALLARFASSDPTPGGGSAAALAGALGAALVAMVCGMEKTKTGGAGERARLDAAAGAVGAAAGRLRALGDEDTAAYDAVRAAYRLPKVGEEEKTARKKAVSSAMAVATEVPLETARQCLAVMAAAVEAAIHGNPNALSDARTAGALAFAGLLGAAENVRINLGPDATGPQASALEGLLRSARTHAAALGLPTG